MRIVITLMLRTVIFCAGALTGNRYGMPESVTNIADNGFDMIDGQLGDCSEVEKETTPSRQTYFLGNDSTPLFIVVAL